ncbi:MAG: 2-hydroxyacyl-CoA dehydratase family protein [bacterium]
MKKNLYTSPFIPAEWIAAHGLQPCRVIPDFQENEEECNPSQGICRHMWQSVQQVNRDTEAAGSIFTTICDQMRRAPECLDASASSRSFLFHVPKTWQSSSSFEWYVAELRRLGSYLIQRGGIEPSADYLKNILQSYDKNRRILLSVRPYMPATAYAELLYRFYTTGIVDSPPIDRAYREFGIPLALIGGPLARINWSLINEVETAGGTIVLDGTENGERTFPAPFDQARLSENPFLEMAHAYFDFIPDIFRRPNDGFFHWLHRALSARSIRGVILIRNVWCDLWHAEVQRIRESIREPLLDLDVDGGDAFARNQTRIQAFLESLQ